VSTAGAANPSPEEVSRRFRAPATAVVRELSSTSTAALWRALLILAPIGFVAGVVAGYFGITDAIAALEPWALALAGGAFVLAYGGVLGALLRRAIGGRLGQLFDVMVWAARVAQLEWEAGSPGSRIPRSAKEARKWLDTHPETDTNRPQRMDAALRAGDLAGARETLQRYPVTSPFERHQRLADGLGIDIVAGKTVTAIEIDADEELGAEHRAHALACRSSTAAFAAVLAGGDWRAPLVAAWPHLPAEAVGVGRRQAELMLIGIHLAIVAIVAGVLAAAWWIVTASG